MTVLLIVLLIVLLFGGGLGWRGGYHNNYPAPFYGGLGLVLIVILILFLLGGFPTRFVR